MNNGKDLAEKIVNQRNWRGEVTLTEKGVKQLIEFCYNKGYSDKPDEKPYVKATPCKNEFTDIFQDMFNNYHGKK